MKKLKDLLSVKARELKVEDDVASAQVAGTLAAIMRELDITGRPYTFRVMDRRILIEAASPGIAQELYLRQDEIAGAIKSVLGEEYRVVIR